jgi:hypothetical protein
MCCLGKINYVFVPLRCRPVRFCLPRSKKCNRVAHKTAFVFMNDGHPPTRRLSNSADIHHHKLQGPEQRFLLHRNHFNPEPGECLPQGRPFLLTQNKCFWPKMSRWFANSFKWCSIRGGIVCFQRAMAGRRWKWPQHIKAKLICWPQMSLCECSPTGVAVHSKAISPPRT